jgi:hypothetical protein
VSTQPSAAGKALVKDGPFRFGLHQERPPRGDSGQATAAPLDGVGITENFIASVLLGVRRPFQVGIM